MPTEYFKHNVKLPKDTLPTLIKVEESGQIFIHKKNIYFDGIWEYMTPEVDEEGNITQPEYWGINEEKNCFVFKHPYYVRISFAEGKAIEDLMKSRFLKKQSRLPEILNDSTAKFYAKEENNRYGVPTTALIKRIHERFFTTDEDLGIDGIWRDCPELEEDWKCEQDDFKEISREEAKEIEVKIRAWKDANAGKELAYVE